jgi:hypothetical protein
MRQSVDLQSGVGFTRATTVFAIHLGHFVEVDRWLREPVYVVIDLYS